MIRSGSNLWKGILANGKSGLFNPAHTVAYIGTNLPTSNKPDIFSRSDNKYGSTRRKLRTEMISSPQGDLKHTGHVGLDGAYFGDISFLGGSSSVCFFSNLNLELIDSSQLFILISL